MKLLRFLTALGACLLLFACDPQDTPPQVDSRHIQHCDNDFSAAPGFEDFLMELTHAVSQKDAAFIDGLVADDIRFSFGLEGGKAAFLQKWQLDSAPESSGFWSEMTELLELGGYTEGMGDALNVVFPCTFRALPPENWMLAQNPQLDAYSYVIVTAEDAALKDAQGTALRTLEKGETLLRAANSQTHFSTHDGMQGIVDAEAIRNPVDYRAFFHQTDEGWKMPLFIAGD